eukprot:s3109_g8.t1
MDFKDVLDKNGVMDKFMALRRNNLVDSKAAMVENGVRDKSMAPARNNLVNSKTVMDEWNSGPTRDSTDDAGCWTYRSWGPEGTWRRRDGTWMRFLDPHHHLYYEFMDDFTMSKVDNGSKKHFDKVGVHGMGNSLNVDHVCYIGDNNKVLDFHETVITKIFYVHVLKEAVKIDFSRGRCIGDCGTRCNPIEMDTNLQQDTNKEMRLAMGEVMCFGLRKHQRMGEFKVMVTWGIQWDYMEMVYMLDFMDIRDKHMDPINVENLRDNPRDL